MIDVIVEFLSAGVFVPHAVCLLWRPDLLALHGASDFLVAISYFAIPFFIMQARKARPDLIDRRVALLFALFIVACGISHVAGVITLWLPYYGWQGLIKFMTALISMFTAVQLWRLWPELMAIPSKEQLAHKEAELIVERRINTSIEESNRKLEEFANIAAHDLRAPLNALRHIPSYIREDIDDPTVSRATINEYIEILQKQAMRMDQLIVDLLDYSKVGQAGLGDEDVDLESVVETAIDLVGPGKDFVIRQEGTLPTIKGVRTEMEMAIRNLIDNAIKHHDRDHGTITVRGRTEANGDCILDIEDDGPGIQDGQFERIFEQFSRIAPRGGAKGTGMGLAIVRRVVESCGGRIEARNREDGRGAVFTLTWASSSKPDSTVS